MKNNIFPSSLSLTESEGICQMAEAGANTKNPESKPLSITSYSGASYHIVNTDGEFLSRVKQVRIHVVTLTDEFTGEVVSKIVVLAELHPYDWNVHGDTAFPEDILHRQVLDVVIDWSENNTKSLEALGLNVDSIIQDIRGYGFIGYFEEFDEAVKVIEPHSEVDFDMYDGEDIYAQEYSPCMDSPIFDLGKESSPHLNLDMEVATLDFEHNRSFEVNPEEDL